MIMWEMGDEKLERGQLPGTYRGNGGGEEDRNCGGGLH